MARPILFDADVRPALRSPGPRTRNSLEYVADVLWGVPLTYPVLVDVPYAWSHYGRQLAWDLFWQTAVTEIVTGAVDAEKPKSRAKREARESGPWRSSANVRSASSRTS